MMWLGGTAGAEPSVMRRVPRMATVLIGGHCMCHAIPTCTCQAQNASSALRGLLNDCCLLVAFAAASVCLLAGSLIFQKPGTVQRMVADPLLAMQQTVATMPFSEQRAVAEVMYTNMSCPVVAEVASTQQLYTSDTPLQQSMTECLKDDEPEDQVTPYSADDFRAGQTPRCACQNCQVHRCCTYRSCLGSA